MFRIKSIDMYNLIKKPKYYLSNKLFFGLIISYFPCRIIVKQEFKKLVYKKKDYELLKKVLYVIETGHKDLYSLISKKTLIKFEEDFGVIFSRHYLINKMSLRRHANFNIAIYSIHKRYIGNDKINSYILGYFSILLQQCLLGHASFYNIFITEQKLFIGNNTFCSNTKNFKELITIDQWRCAVILLTYKKSDEVFIHFSDNRDYSDFLWKQAKVWLKGKNNVKAKIISYNTKYYVSKLATIDKSITFSVYTKKRTEGFDVLLDSKRFFYKINIKTIHLQNYRKKFLKFIAV